MSELIETYQETLDWAKKAHGKQLRKYTFDSYISHPVAVALLLEQAGESLALEQAALLHDVLEDTAVDEQELRKVFPKEVCDIVVGVTDVSVPEDGNRATRKALDHQHIADGTREIHALKLADCIDNIMSIMMHDHSFLKVYVKEIGALYEHIKGGNDYLAVILKTLLDATKYQTTIMEINKKVIRHNAHSRKASRVIRLDYLNKRLKEKLNRVEVNLRAVIRSSRT